MKQAYLASPFFKNKEIHVYDEVIKILKEKGYDLFIPRDHEVENAWGKSNTEWARDVFIADLNALNKADIVFVINHGMYSDSGTAWECGYAYAKEKMVVNILVDTMQKDKSFSLMMINGADMTIPLELLESVDIDKLLESEQNDYFNYMITQK